MSDHETRGQKKTPGGDRGFDKVINQSRLKATDSHSLAKTSHENTNAIQQKWSGYSAFTTKKHFWSQHNLSPYWCRQTKEENTVLGLVKPQSKLPCNLRVVRPDGHHQDFHDLQPGECAPCDANSIDPEYVIATETYISALVLARRWENYSGVHVVCCFKPENIYPVLDGFFKKWPYVTYFAAPDTRDKTLCDGVLYPPGNMTWLELHRELQQWTT